MTNYHVTSMSQFTIRLSTEWWKKIDSSCVSDWKLLIVYYIRVVIKSYGMVYSFRTGCKYEQYL